jgi:hypothetical protein
LADGRDFRDGEVLASHQLLRSTKSSSPSTDQKSGPSSLSPWLTRGPRRSSPWWVYWIDGSAEQSPLAKDDELKKIQKEASLEDFDISRQNLAEKLLAVLDAGD